jgi:DnaJ-class molecular chaperone
MNPKLTLILLGTVSFIIGVYSQDRLKRKEDISKAFIYLTAYPFILLGIGFLLMGMIGNFKPKEYDPYSDTRMQTIEERLKSSSSEIHYTECAICGRKFKGNGYEEVSEGVWRECSDDKQSYICSRSCGLRQTAKLNSLVNRTSSDNRIHESSVCSLCKGTGIEKNTGHLSNEYGRVCPMCGGKGTRSY